MNTADTAATGQRTAPPLLLCGSLSRRLSPQYSVTSASTAKNIGIQPPTDQMTSLIACPNIWQTHAASSITVSGFCLRVLTIAQTAVPSRATKAARPSTPRSHSIST